MKKEYKSGKPQSEAFKGNAQSKGKKPVDNTTQPDATTRLLPDHTPYEHSKNPLKRAMGIHDSTKISPQMAQKFATHPEPAVANAAKKIAKGYDSSIGGGA